MWTNKIIPLVAGMDDSLSAGQHPEPILTRLINAKVVKSGGIEKRDGFAGQPNTIYDEITDARSLINGDGADTIFTPKALITNNSRRQGATSDALYALASSVLFRYNSSLGWIPTDPYIVASDDGYYKPTAAGCSTEYRTVNRSGRDHHNTQTCSTSSYVLVAWIEVSGSYGSDAAPRLYYSVYDKASSSYIVDGVAVESSQDVKYCMTVGNSDDTFIGIVYLQGNNLKFISLADILVPVTYTLKTTAYNTGAIAPMYVAHDPANDGMVVAYRDTVANFTVFHSTYDGIVTNTTSFVIATNAAGIQSVAIEPNAAGTRYVCAAGYLNAAAASRVNTYVLDSTLTDLGFSVNHVGAVTDTTRVPIRISIGFNATVMGVAPTPNCDVWMAWQLANAAASTLTHTTVIAGRLTTSNSTPFTSVELFRVTLLGTMFNYDNVLYVPLGYESALQSCLYVVAVGNYIRSTEALAIAGKTAPGISAGNMDGRVGEYYAPPCRVGEFAVGQYVVGNRVKTSYVEGPTIGRTLKYAQSCFALLDFTCAVSTAEVGNTIYIANGSVLKQYSGTTVVEAGFLLGPELVNADITTAGAAGFLSAGSYTWRFYYESVVGGVRTRSYAFQITKTGVANTNTATITLPTLRFTQRDDVVLVGYRTKVNPTAESPFYRVTSLGPGLGSSTGSEGCGWYLNTFSADTVTITDGIADAFLLSETDYLYTGEVGHVLPDAQQFVVQHGNRLVTASSNSVQPSLLMSDRYTVEFSDELEFGVSKTGGAIKAIQTLGNNLAIFKKNRISIVGGDGPDNTNQGSYSNEYEISNAVGTYSQATTCKVPGGVAFAGPSGFYILNEGLQLDFIGKAVAPVFIKEGYACTRVIYNHKESYIAFVTVVGTYVFYTQTGVWTIWQTFGGVTDAAIYNDVMANYYSAGSVAIQTVAYRDSDYDSGGVNNRNFTHSLMLDNVAITDGDPASHARIRSIKFIGTHMEGATSSAYTVEVAYDGTNNIESITDGTFEDSGTYTVSSTSTATTWPLDKARFEHWLARQKCSSIQIKLSQLDNAKGCRWTHVVLVVKQSMKTGKMSPRDTA